MKHAISRELSFWVTAEYRNRKDRLQNLKRSEIISGILNELQNEGYAAQYIRRDGKVGWRATPEMREDLFKREGAVVLDQLDKPTAANYSVNSLPLQHFHYKPKIDYKNPNYTAHGDQALLQEIERLRDLWEKTQASRDRDAVYGFLSAAFEQILCWRAEGQESQRAKRALKINGLAPPKDPEPFAAIIAASVSPKKLDRRQLSKYSRVLQFAARLNIHPRDFKRFVKDRCGGLNVCAARL